MSLFFWTFHIMNVLLLKLPATKVENPVNKKIRNTKLKVINFQQ